MSDPAIELNEEHLERIGTYVRSHFHKWLLEDRELNGDAIFNQLNRLESSLEASIILSRERFELMDRRFDLVEKRFAQVDKRFAQVDKRFAQVDKRFAQVDKRFDEQMAFTRERFAFTDKRFDEQIMLLKAEFANRTELEKDRFGHLEKRMNRQFTVYITFVSAVFAAVIGVLVQGFFF